jgi:hypothetical protein
MTIHNVCDPRSMRMRDKGSMLLLKDLYWFMQRKIHIERGLSNVHRRLEEPTIESSRKEMEIMLF